MQKENGDNGCDSLVESFNCSFMWHKMNISGKDKPKILTVFFRKSSPLAGSKPQRDEYEDMRD